MISNVVQALHGVSQSKGTKAKVLAIHDAAAELGAAFEQTLLAIYDPLTTYGITGNKFREALKLAVDTGLDEQHFMHKLSGGTNELDDLFKLMTRLAERELTGARAMNAIVGATFNASCSQLDEKMALIAMMLDHDARAGIGIDLINTAIPNLIPTFDPMLAHPFDKKRVKQWPVGVEPKWDGFRMLALVNTAEGSVQYLSRSGRTWDEMEHITSGLVNLSAELLREIESSEARIMIDGEIVAAGHFNETASVFKKKGQKDATSSFKVFDFILAHEFESRKSSATYTDRRNMLRRCAPIFERSTGITLSESYIASSEDEALVLYQSFRDRGYEGAIVKLMEGKYEFKRSYNWMKIKPKETLDLKIIGAFEGELGTKYEGKLGGVIVDFKGVQVRVGGGFSDVEREILWRDYHEGRLVGRLIEVEFHEITPDGSLRHPRFKRFRSDIDGDKY